MRSSTSPPKLRRTTGVRQRRGRADGESQDGIPQRATSNAVAPLTVDPADERKFMEAQVATLQRWRHGKRMPPRPQGRSVWISCRGRGGATSSTAAVVATNTTSAAAIGVVTAAYATTADDAAAVAADTTDATEVADMKRKWERRSPISITRSW
ncbi:GM11689 [Drosophila sechellia]|uniref:GM11689 n=1 Tax=Drosophila sechellia TaxID=7238 RepID=B4IL13_DROSE|nr:GM11689 [Drosophila sechellia]